MAVRKVLMYTTNWCGDCKRARQLLAELQIEYENVDIERDPAAVAAMVKLTGGTRRVPTVLVMYEDGTKKVLVEPSNGELKLAAER